MQIYTQSPLLLPSGGQQTERRDAGARESRQLGVEQAATAPASRRDLVLVGRRVEQLAASERARIAREDNISPTNRNAIASYLSNRPSAEEQLGVQLAGIDEFV